MSERSRNDKGQFAPTVDTEGVPSVQETPEQRERNNHTMVAEKNSGCNSLACGIVTYGENVFTCELGPTILFRCKFSIVA